MPGHALQPSETTRYANLMIGHGLGVVLVGLVAGLMLAIFLLGGVSLWPLPTWAVALPGSSRGWVAAHSGGILNGVMISVAALLVLHLKLEGRALKWVALGMIITGWANTVFYWAGNLAANRGLSATPNVFGPADLAGVVAYAIGSLGMVFTFIAVIVLARSAFSAARRPA